MSTPKDQKITITNGKHPNPDLEFTTDINKTLEIPYIESTRKSAYNYYHDYKFISNLMYICNNFKKPEKRNYVIMLTMLSSGYYFRYATFLRWEYDDFLKEVKRSPSLSSLIEDIRDEEIENYIRKVMDIFVERGIKALDVLKNEIDSMYIETMKEELRKELEDVSDEDADKFFGEMEKAFYAKQEILNEDIKKIISFFVKTRKLEEYWFTKTSTLAGLLIKKGEDKKEVHDAVRETFRRAMDRATKKEAQHVVDFNIRWQVLPVSPAGRLLMIGGENFVKKPGAERFLKTNCEAQSHYKRVAEVLDLKNKEEFATLYCEESRLHVKNMVGTIMPPFNKLKDVEMAKLMSKGEKYDEPIIRFEDFASPSERKAAMKAYRASDIFKQLERASEMQDKGIFSRNLNYKEVWDKDEFNQTITKYHFDLANRLKD